MPPPTRANRACSEAPIANDRSIVVSCTGSSPELWRIRNQAEMSSSAKPVTTMPMTAPARKATFRPALSDSFTAAVVRAEAFVAVFMPRKPHRPDRNEAMMKPSQVMPLCIVVSLASEIAVLPMMNSTTASTTTMIDTILYWRFR